MAVPMTIHADKPVAWNFFPRVSLERAAVPRILSILNFINQQASTVLPILFWLHGQHEVNDKKKS